MAGKKGPKPATQAGIQAVRADLGAVEKRLRTDLGTVEKRLDGKINSVADRLDGKINSVADRLDGKIDSVADRLDQKIDSVAAEMFRRLDATAGKEDVTAIQDYLNRITNTLDSISGRLNDQDRATVVFDKILKDHRIKLEDHDKRLVVLESAD